jgi:hypothetical protein
MRGANTDKFLTYEPWNGDLNNLRLCFESVAALAHVLGRKVVLSPRHRILESDPDWVDGVCYPLHPPRFFDLTNVPTASVDDIPSGTVPYCVDEFHPDFGFITLCDGPDMEAFAAGRTAHRLPSETADATVINLPPLLAPFYVNIYADAATRRAMVNHVRQNVRHYSVAEATARAVADKLGEFHSVVIRRNDFIRAYPQVDVPAAQIAEIIAERAPSDALLVIATDEPDGAYFTPLAQRWRLLFARDLVEPVTPQWWTQRQRSCVEQNLCALGKSYVGTRLSSFSGYVNRLRGYFGVEDTSVRFTDGTHLRVDDTDTMFSWQAWRGHGEPVWGREFKEGWLPL